MTLVRKLLWAGGVAAWLAVAAIVGFWLRPVSYLNESMYLRAYFAGVESSTVTVAGHHVHYNAEGPAGGPVVVLIHGLGGRAEDWHDLAPYLAKAGFRVYMPDLLGYGRSEKPSGFSYSVPDESEFVVGFLDALGLKQVDLGGWSMGGGIAQFLAARHPERVSRLMLFDAAGIYQKPSWDTSLFTPRTPQQLSQFYALLMPHPPAIPEFVVRDILRISKKNAWVIQRAMGTMLAGQGTTDALLPQLKMPVLIVWGAEDRILPLSQGEKMHSLVPQSVFEVFPSCGHLAPSQCAAQIGPKVVEFVNQ